MPTGRRRWSRDLRSEEQPTVKVPAYERASLCEAWLIAGAGVTIDWRPVLSSDAERVQVGWTLINPLTKFPPDPLWIVGGVEFNEPPCGNSFEVRVC